MNMECTKLTQLTGLSFLRCNWRNNCYNFLCRVKVIRNYRQDMLVIVWLLCGIHIFVRYIRVQKVSFGQQLRWFWMCLSPCKVIHILLSFGSLTSPVSTPSPYLKLNGPSPKGQVTNGPDLHVHLQPLPPRALTLNSPFLHAQNVKCVPNAPPHSRKCTCDPSVCFTLRASTGHHRWFLASAVAIENLSFSSPLFWGPESPKNPQKQSNWGTILTIRTHQKDKNCNAPYAVWFWPCKDESFKLHHSSLCQGWSLIQCILIWEKTWDIQLVIHHPPNNGFTDSILRI